MSRKEDGVRKAHRFFVGVSAVLLAFLGISAYSIWEDGRRFALVGEQLGLLGAATVLALLAVIAWRGLLAAAHAPDRLGQLLAAGPTAVIFAQATVHVAVNLRLLPATGIPLPYVSQGGSALVAMALAAGIIASVAARRPPTSREQWTAQRWHA